MTTDTQSKGMVGLEYSAYFCFALYSGSTTASFLEDKIGELIFFRSYTSVFVAVVIAAGLLVALAAIKKLSQNIRITTNKLAIVIGLYGCILFLVSTATSAAFIARKSLIQDILSKRVNRAQELFLQKAKDSQLSPMELQIVELQDLATKLTMEQKLAFDGAHGRMKKGTGQIEGFYGRAAKQINIIFGDLKKQLQKIKKGAEAISNAINWEFRKEILGRPGKTPTKRLAFFQERGAAFNTAMNGFFKKGQNTRLQRVMAKMGADIDMTLQDPHLSAGQREYLRDVRKIKLPIWNRSAQKVQDSIKTLNTEKEIVTFFDLSEVDLYKQMLASLGGHYHLPYAIAIFMDFMPLLIILLHKFHDKWQIDMDIEYLEGEIATG